MELLETIRAEPKTQSLPVIVVSAAADDAHLVMSAAQNVVAVLSKPIVADRLVDVVRDAIELLHAEPHVLHIEDDPDIRVLVRKILPKHWRLDSAPTMAEGRRLLGATTYHLVLLDLSLPDGQGESLLEYTSETPVVLFTAQDVRGSLASRVQSVLIKTRATEQDLLRTLRRFVPLESD
jgi:DNA-binding response OmpR family regulator